MSKEEWVASIRTDEEEMSGEEEDGEEDLEQEECLDKNLWATFIS